MCMCVYIYIYIYAHTNRFIRQGHMVRDSPDELVWRIQAGTLFWQMISNLASVSGNGISELADDLILCLISELAILSLSLSIYIYI